jgi:CRISPR-associated protein Cmr1
VSGIVTLARAELRFLTPAFVAGADQTFPELRAASIKSALRFLYRAADPLAVLTKQKGDPRNEDLCFGGGGEKALQSPFLLRVAASEQRPFEWDHINIDRFNEGSGTHRKNGLRYLSYSLHMRGNDGRPALPPGLSANLTIQAERRRLADTPSSARRAWIAALWLLGNLGSLGTRSRRGLGSLEITNWSRLAEAEWQKDASLLPNLQTASNPKDWMAGFSQAMGVFADWFGSFDEKAYGGLRFCHPHLGEHLRVALLGEGFRSWEEALNAAGRRLQDFRVRRRPDYDDVKRALQGRGALSLAPERAAFGLPLTFRYSSVPDAQAEFVPTREGGKDRKRQASLLRIRLVRLGDRLYPLFVRMEGAVPGEDPGADLLLRRKGERDGREELRGSAGPKLLDEFMESLSRG